MISYYFVTKNFGKALELLSKLDITTPSDKLAIKKFQFMIYYELNYFEELTLLIDSSRHHISQDKIFSAETKKKFTEFTIIMKKLLSLKSSVDDKDEKGFKAEELKKEIVSKDAYNKIWLIEKIEEMNV